MIGHSPDKQPNTSSWDVVVVGAGAAGLLAAATAASRDRRTLLLEKNNKLGVKILMSGGTRCNVTQNTDWRGIADAFGGQQGRFLKHALASFPPEQVVTFFESLGVACKVESTGKVFPQSDRAIDVRDALVEYAEQEGATILPATPVSTIAKTETGFAVQTDQATYDCQSLLVTTGGQSYPGCGTVGDGYAWLKALGHTIQTPHPALTPIRVSDQWVRELSGVTLPDMQLSVEPVDAQVTRESKKEPRGRDRGSFLFTHFGCSGPVPMNVSRMLTAPGRPYRKQLVCDWLPNQREDHLRQSLLSPEKRVGSWSLAQWLGDHLPKRLIAALSDHAGIAGKIRMAELSKNHVNALVQNLKRCSLHVQGTQGFEKAEVTSGGVTLSEVDAKRMESKKVPGLFLAGEILDVDGPIGGYNFQAAFSTGRLAGLHA